MVMNSNYLSEASKVLLPTLAVDFGIQLAGFGVAALLQTEKFYDLAGSTSFIACTYMSLFKPWKQTQQDPSSSGSSPVVIHPRQVLASGTTVVWALYLGSFLFKRAMKHGDKRFDKVKTNPRRFLFYWLIQGVWVALTALPVYLTNSIPGEAHPPIGLRDLLGFVLWGGGFAFEVIANYQKQKWRREIGKDYKRSFISSGLWSLSRHPNYFGECVLWFGSYLFSSNGFSSTLNSEQQVLSDWMTRLAVLSPVFVTVLITRVSGIPLLERENDRRLKDVVAYWRYKKQTSMFVPTWPHPVAE
ncbi:hypothetical protein BGZ83_007472 [Gryganskiella cystojenkinii]|nr:hypothetical protein BGZ83_007472 [Gryganskiella cystojenkinii]